VTMVLESNPNFRNTFSGSSSDFTADMKNMAGLVSDLPSVKRSSNGTEEGSGSNLKERGKAASSPSPSQYQPKGSKPAIRVLLAEDNPGDVFLVSAALRSEKLETELTVERDGERMLRRLNAIESGQSACPDIVLLDLNLPKYSGAKLLEKMRSSTICAHVPVVIVTSSDAPCDREIASRFKAAGYFRKPTEFDEFVRLGRLVRTLLGL